MEPLPDPACRPGLRCLLLLPPLLLLLLSLPDLGPSQAHADETDWVRLPSKCEGEGAGPTEDPAGGGVLAEKDQGTNGVPWAPEPVSSLLVPSVCVSAGDSGLSAPGANKI